MKRNVNRDMDRIFDNSEKLTLDEYQGIAQRTSRKDLTKDQHLHNAMLGLAGETGECCDLVKKHYYQDGREIRDKLIDELSDCLWYIAEAASALDVYLGDIGVHNKEKLEKRYPAGFDAERSLHREE